MLTDINYASIESRKKRIILEIKEPSIKVAIVEKSGSFSSEWNQNGVYLLISSMRGKLNIYIGKGILSTRASQHRREKRGWQKGIFIQGLLEPLTHDPCHYLEHKLITDFSMLKDILLINKNQPSESAIPFREQRYWDRIANVVPNLIYAAGYQYDPKKKRKQPYLPASDKTEILKNNNTKQEKELEKRTNTSPKIKDDFGLPELVMNGFIQPNTIIFPRGRKYKAKARIDKDGAIWIEDRQFDSPSKAGKAVTQQSTCEGWRFWKTVWHGNTVSLAEIRDEYRKTRTQEQEDKPITPPKPVPLPVPTHPHQIKLDELISDEVFKTPITIQSTVSRFPARATLRKGGTVEYKGEVYDSLSKAGKKVIGDAWLRVNGWEFWGIVQDGKLTELKEVRRQYFISRYGKDR